MSRPRVIGVQLDLVWENPAANRAKALAYLEGAVIPAGSLVVLPEMFASGFSMNTSTVAEPAGGATEHWLLATAQRLGVTLLAGLARREPDGVCANEALVVSPKGELLSVYRKQRLFTPGGEAEHYTAGRDPSVFHWGEIPVATFICYDLRFPELFRVAARQRPLLYVVIASWPDKRVAHWLKLLEARAIENQAYVIGVNRLGDDPSHHYPGRSVIVNPWGEVIADGGHEEGLVTADLDLAALRSYREKLPFLEDLKCCSIP